MAIDKSRPEGDGEKAGWAVGCVVALGVLVTVPVAVLLSGLWMGWEFAWLLAQLLFWVLVLLVIVGMTFVEAYERARSEGGGSVVAGFLGFLGVAILVVGAVLLDWWLG